MQMGQYGSNMELEWTGVRTHASKTTTSSKGFILTHTHLLIIYLSCIVHNVVYFSPLQVENKSHDGTMNVCLFLGLLARLQTS
jgi:hypothetical protein